LNGRQEHGRQNKVTGQRRRENGTGTLSKVRIGHGTGILSKVKFAKASRQKVGVFIDYSRFLQLEHWSHPCERKQDKRS